VQVLLPIIAACRQRQGDMGFDIRRTQARRVGAEVLAGTLDFGVLVSQDVAPGLQTLTIGLDELDVLMYPSHPLAGRTRITMEEFHQQIIVIHNDASPARDRLLRLFADRQLPITTAIISLPSLDAIKQAVEMQLGVTLLPRRAAIRELAEGRLVAVPLSEVSEPRALRLAYRRDAELSPPARLFLEVASEIARSAESGKRPAAAQPAARVSRSKQTG
jgi:DNA-binding transcriptional LysR family regulator